MSTIRTLPGINDVGFDPRNNLLVVPVRKTASVYLVDTSVLGTDVEVDDESVAKVAEDDLTKRQVSNQRFTKDERAHPLSRVSIKGLRVGTTTLRAQRSVGSDNFIPITVQVVEDADARQAGEKGIVTPELREELLGLSLRQAVLRVAEDQMYSAIGRRGGGFGKYADKSYDWCGAFAWYCWNVACKVHGKTNPFGEKYNSLLSCQKAISWALQTDSCTILRYKGYDPFGNSFTTGKSLGKAAERQEYIEISPQNPVMPADIAILRTGTPSDWKHVCLVWQTPTGDILESIDGNMGYPCIKRQSRPWMNKMVNNGKDHAVIFLHVLGFDE